MEAWLNSLNQGAAGRPARYAPEALSQRILPHWATRDPGDLDLIEVGKGRATKQAGPAFLVPYRVKDIDGHERKGLAGLVRVRDGWRVAGLLAGREAPDLAVPSQGGRRYASASGTLWLLGLGIAALLIGGTVVLMSTVGKASPRTA